MEAIAHYAYMWTRENGVPYYIGIGSRTTERAFTSSGHTCHRPKDGSRILIFPRGSRAEAIETEKELIANWGRKDNGTGCLRNRTDGGDDGCGAIYTREHQVKAGKAAGRFAVEHKLGFHALTAEQRRAAGLKGGALRAEAMRLNPIHTPEGSLRGGQVTGERNRISGHMAAIGKQWAAINSQTENAKNGRLRFLHERWHVRRGIVSPTCQLCEQTHA